MKPALAALALAALLPYQAGGQAPGKFPPDSLVNLKVIPKTTPVMQVVGQMRNITGDLGLRAYRTDGGAWSLHTGHARGAFRIEASPVPGPGALVVLGIAALGSRRRR